MLIIITILQIYTHLLLIDCFYNPEKKVDFFIFFLFLEASE